MRSNVGKDDFFINGHFDTQYDVTDTLLKIITFNKY